jgi:hypothetical protein
MNSNMWLAQLMQDMQVRARKGLESVAHYEQRLVEGTLLTW